MIVVYWMVAHGCCGAVRWSGGVVSVLSVDDWRGTQVYGCSVVEPRNTKQRHSSTQSLKSSQVRSKSKPNLSAFATSKGGEGGARGE